MLLGKQLSDKSAHKKNAALAFGVMLIMLNGINAYAQEPPKLVDKNLRSDLIVLDAQFPGPFQDTLIQRWIDKSTGNICYLYIPAVVPAIPSSSNTTNRIYGPNSIGDISCVPGVKNR